MPRQSYEGNKTVLEAARERISFVFEAFSQVIVSGGKDSSVLCHLALMEAKRRNRRVGLYFLDEEVVYQATVDQVEYLMGLEPEHTIPMWLQVPFHLTNAVSIEEGQVQCWEPGQHKIWMRPKKRDSMQHPPWDRAKETVHDRRKGFGFYDAITNFERCHPAAAFLVGLRAAGESPNRWRAVTKNPVTIAGQQVYWATRKEATVLYPIYDWNVHDVWRYTYDAKLKYHKAYDWQFKQGVSIPQMRVSSLTHERAFKSIVDLPAFEPKTYEKLRNRIKGVALAQETGKSAKLFACRKLPKNFKSWVTYRDFLLDTYADPSRVQIFRTRFAKHRVNEYVARQQCRQLLLGDYENNLSVDNAPDPRDEVIDYYEKEL